MLVTVAEVWQRVCRSTLSVVLWLYGRPISNTLDSLSTFVYLVVSAGTPDCEKQRYVFKGMPHVLWTNILDNRVRDSDSQALRMVLERPLR